jgi:hypothetical protein
LNVRDGPFNRFSPASMKPLLCLSKKLLDVVVY